MSRRLAEYSSESVTKIKSLPIFSGPPPASRTTASTFSSAWANCSAKPSLTILDSRSHPIWPATKRTDPPSNNTPLLYPRGWLSASGLIIFIFVGAPSQILRFQSTELLDLPACSFLRLSLNQPEPGGEIIDYDVLAVLSIDCNRLESADRRCDVLRAQYIENNHRRLIAGRRRLPGPVENCAKRVLPGGAFCRHRLRIRHRQRVFSVLKLRGGLLTLDVAVGGFREDLNSISLANKFAGD